MTNHEWLTNDRSVQFSDWDTGDRVIVTFGDRRFEPPSGQPVLRRSFVIEKLEGK
jgi:hypothetical protein